MKKLLFMLMLMVGSALGAVQPTAPATFDTSYSLPIGGTKWKVYGGMNLQTALNNAKKGDVIELAAGATFTGNFRVDPKLGQGWVYIVSDERGSLPEGKRVSAADAGHMPKIVARSGGQPALYTIAFANHYRFVGIDFQTSGNVYNLIQTGYTLNSSGVLTAVSVDSDLPHDIVFDRCLIRSTSNAPPPAFARTGVMLNGKFMAVVDSEISNFKEQGSDGGHGIEIWQGAGPYKIKNTKIAASGIGMIVGGTDPKIAGSVPGDITVSGNYFWKDPAWNGIWTIKNAFELKNAQRVAFAGNIIENVLRDNSGQSATAIVLTPRNQSGTAPWSVVKDVKISNNRVSHVGVGFRITGTDDIHSSQQTQRIMVSNNAFDDLNMAYFSGSSGFNISSVGNVPATDVIVWHNLILHTGKGSKLEFLSAPTGTIAVHNLSVRNNVFTLADYGVFGNGVGSGTVALNAFATDYAWTRNVTINRSVDRDYETWKVNFASWYPADNALADELAGVGFTDTASGNYKLLPGSTFSLWASDGKDPGPDWTVLNAAIAKSKVGK